MAAAIPCLPLQLTPSFLFLKRLAIEPENSQGQAQSLLPFRPLPEVRRAGAGILSTPLGLRGIKRGLNGPGGGLPPGEACEVSQSPSPGHRPSLHLGR